MSEVTETERERMLLIGATAEITCALVATRTPALPVSLLPDIITSIYGALEKAGSQESAPPEFTPAVDPKKSVKRDHIISLIDGKPYKMLKRHLTTQGLTPDEYRDRYGLPASYPMVAPSYSERRSQMAKEIGLGKETGK